MVNQKNILRIIDANYNRSREALRVCEDITRFIFNSAEISRELKMLRHLIGEILLSSPLSIKSLLGSRDIKKDVGKMPRPHIELPRHTVGDIFAANIQRAKESIRVLEELYKIIDIKSSQKFSHLRFKVYQIEILFNQRYLTRIHKLEKMHNLKSSYARR